MTRRLPARRAAQASLRIRRPGAAAARDEADSNRRPERAPVLGSGYVSEDQGRHAAVRRTPDPSRRLRPAGDHRPDRRTMRRSAPPGPERAVRAARRGAGVHPAAADRVAGGARRLRPPGRCRPVRGAARRAARRPPDPAPDRPVGHGQRVRRAGRRAGRVRARARHPDRPVRAGARVAVVEARRRARPVARPGGAVLARPRRGVLRRASPPSSTRPRTPSTTTTTCRASRRGQGRPARHRPAPVRAERDPARAC